MDFLYVLCLPQGQIFKNKLKLLKKSFMTALTLKS